MNWFEKLKVKWNASTYQVVMILIVFTCTGFTVMFLKEPILSLIAEKEERTVWFSVVYYLLILPVYNIILLFYGYIFGQFQFFLEFEKKMLRRIFGNKKADQ